MKTLIRLVASVFVFASCAMAFAQDVPPHAVEPPVADQILLISTRGYASVVGRTLDLQVTHARELNADGTRTPTVLPLDRPFDSRETWLFVHGNQIPPSEAIRRGLKVYRNLRTYSTGKSIRFVIWSWPSQREGHRIKDAKRKATRTDVESFLLGSYLTKLASETPSSIIAYSFGARIVSGALHLAAGGQLCGYQLPQRLENHVPLRLAFLAPAVENDGLHPRRGRYARGLDPVESLLLLNNSRDKALNFFWIINKSKPKAMGDTGIVCAPGHCKIRQFDWAKTIGKDHSLHQYIDRPAVLRQIAGEISR